jgi:hypothetical protein
MGRFHPARIYEIERESEGEGEGEGECLVIGALLLSADRLACPLSRRDDTLIFADVILSPPGNKASYRSARLLSVGTVHGIRLKTGDVGDLLDDPRSLWSLLESKDEVLPISDASLDPAVVSLIERIPEDVTPGAPTRNFTVFDSGKDYGPEPDSVAADATFDGEGS